MINGRKMVGTDMAKRHFSRSLTYSLTACFILLFCHISMAAPVRGVVGDNWADIVIGQPDFGQSKPNEAVNNRVFVPGGVLVDRSSSPQRLYIWDAGNSRVLGFSDIYNAVHQSGGALCLGSNAAAVAQGADIVLGQPDFKHCACNGDSNFQNYPLPTQPNASTLCGMPAETISPLETHLMANMAVDAAGDLYVPDFMNNRVLRYNAPVTSGQAASYVWGQGASLSNFTTGYNTCAAPSATSFCFNSYLPGTGVGVDTVGNLWVADTGHNRVLRFPVDAYGVPQATADLVLGQANFNSQVAPSGTSDMTKMQFPQAVRVDSAGNVYVADNVYDPSSPCGYHVSGRILVYHPPLTTGMAASAAFINNMGSAVGLEFDPAGGLWVNDFCAGQLLLLGVSPGSPDNFTVTKILLRDSPTNTYNGGETGLTGDGPNFNYAAGGAGGSYSGNMAPWGGIGVDNDGNVFVTPREVQEIWRFPAPIPTMNPAPNLIAHSADVALFKTPQWGIWNHTGMIGLLGIDGIGVAATGGQLIVADDFHMRFWNMPSGPAGLANGQACDGIAGVPTASIPFEMHPTFKHIREDHAAPQQHLWVLREAHNIRIEVYNLPLTNMQMPFKTIYSPLPVLGGGSVSWTGVEGAVPDDAGTHLWVVDQQNSRVFRIRDPLTSPVVDIVLGQPDLSGVSCNQPSGTPSSSNLCQPGNARLDHHGNLYISDSSLEASGNWRLLRWDKSTLPDAPAACVFGIAASAVYARNGDFTTGSGGCLNPADPALRACGPWEPAFTSDDSKMVVGMNGYTGSRFPLIFTDPAYSDNISGRLFDYGSMFFTSTFDEQDNYYIADLDRGRVLIYLQPFSTPTYTQTASPTATDTIPAPTLTDTPVDTATPAETRTATITSTVTGTSTAAPTQTCTATATQTALPCGQNSKIIIFPNPAFDTTAKLRIGVCDNSDVKLCIYTLAMRKIREEYFGHVMPGDDIVFSITDNNGRAFATGIYTVTVKISATADPKKTRKWIGQMVVLKK